jgi:lipopolysaccharide biosynthesis protein
MKVENLIFSEQKVERLKLPTISVVVHLHLFYLDLIPDFLKYLRHIPVPFSLLISIPEGVVADDNDVKKLFCILSNMREIIIKHTPNKGRDIAPMLCSFAEEIQKYDVLLHLHTKKTLHHKDMLEGWLKHILEHLLPSDICIISILSRLSRDAGMIIPPDFVSYNVAFDSWGTPKNLAIAQDVMTRGGLNINLKKEYPEIVYPEGGMFWACTEYLHRLFALGLTYDDFPEEPIGIDGTIAHALERLYCLWGIDGEKKVFRTYFFESEQTVTRRLAKERWYFIGKNRKHLMMCRILGVLCLVLFVLLLISIFI